MTTQQKVLNDCRKIMQGQLNRERIDWDLWWQQVHAMDKKYKKYGEDVYRFMQECIQNVFHTLRMMEGVNNGTENKS